MEGQLVLENNFFDDKYYFQIQGSAMGTQFAPAYATLVLCFLEVKMYTKTQGVFGAKFAKYIQNQWKRLLDDCFIFWNRLRDIFMKFHKLLNELHKKH